MTRRTKNFKLQKLQILNGFLGNITECFEDGNTIIKIEVAFAGIRLTSIFNNLMVPEIEEHE